MRFGAQEDPVDGLCCRGIRESTQRDVGGSLGAFNDQAVERAPGARNNVVAVCGAQRPRNAAADASEPDHGDGRAVFVRVYRLISIN